MTDMDDEFVLDLCELFKEKSWTLFKKLMEDCDKFEYAPSDIEKMQLVFGGVLDALDKLAHACMIKTDKLRKEGHLNSNDYLDICTVFRDRYKLSVGYIEERMK